MSNILPNTSTIIAPGLEQRSAGLPSMVNTTLLPSITITGTETKDPLDEDVPRSEQRARRAMVRAREMSYPEVDVTDVDFALYSTKEIDDMAVVKVDSELSSGRNTVYDPRMGPHNISEYCEKCFKGVYECTGHIGKIEIPKIPHPLTIDFLISVLSVVCNKCGKLLITQADMERQGISKYSGVGKLAAVRKLVEKTQRICERSDMPMAERCGVSPNYNSPKDNKGEYLIAYKYPKGETNYLTPDEVYDILDMISEEDARLMGFAMGQHPRNFIMERLIVVPYCARPDMYQGDMHMIDDLTRMYQDIIKEVRKYKAETKESEKKNRLQMIYFRISHFMKNNDGLYTQGTNKPFFSVSERLQGKKAIIRQNIMGKRVEYAGRTVIAPGPYLRVDQIGIPRIMTRELTLPMVITAANQAECQSKLDNGKVISVVIENSEGQISLGFEHFRRKYPDYRLNVGDVIHRMLEDGDIVLFNRPPTLHKQNFIALKVVVIDDLVIRLNLSLTTPMNADFDGDEGSIHVPQTLQAYVEAEELLSVGNNLITAGSNKPIMAIVYDSLTGSYLLTWPEHQVDKIKKEIESLEKQLTDRTLSPEKKEDFQQKLNKKQGELSKWEEKVMVDPVIFNIALSSVIDRPQISTLKKRINQAGVTWGSGRSLFSACLPEDFDYNHEGVKIIDGVLVSGVLSKKTLGTVSKSIVDEMVRQLGPKATVDFMSDLQFIIREYLQRRGFSIGLDDCLVADADTKKMIADKIEDAELKVLTLTGEVSSHSAALLQERKIQEALDLPSTLGQKLIQERLSPENALVIMANSGAKGTAYNTGMISSLLGQQSVRGKRLPANLPGNRSLPVFEPNDPRPQSRGFCVNSYAAGLEPEEFFFHQMGSREGISDTGVNTSKNGDLQRKAVKSLEDLHVSPDGSVRSVDHSIFDFIYGGDGMDAEKIQNVSIDGKDIPFFRNINLLASKINRKYGAK